MIENLIEESIALEKNVAALYKIFSESVPEDADFWWQLHLEEKSHATLIRAAKDSFVRRGKFPFDLIANSVEELKSSNQRIAAMVGKFLANPPSRLEALEVAIALENEAGESHYNQFMDKEAKNPVEGVFQQLNRDDKEHETRIRERLASV
ncbi:MAG: hypothetical protein KJN67_05260 [Pontiella sp.]|nr:hypothetical protein [Pontiella sp.]MBT8046554.1 hypothetical protein [Pontiella sp.]NNJ70811.1 rubrerythrin family protein [Kiritimatiellales bacterium]